MRKSYSIAVYLMLALMVTTCLSSTFAGTDKGNSAPENASIDNKILDGRKFKGPTGEMGKKSHHVDVLSFSNGIFTSSECFQFGFKGGPYTATVHSDSIQFKAVTNSPTHGKMEWSGTLKGDILNVTYSWTKKRWFWTTYREYWFKGELVK